MNAYREKDYDDMAGRCVDRFLSGETKLADAAVHEAMQGQLNPDQIERLVQAANTMAFLRMMESRKAEGALVKSFNEISQAGVSGAVTRRRPSRLKIAENIKEQPRRPAFRVAGVLSFFIQFGWALGHGAGFRFRHWTGRS